MQSGYNWVSDHLESTYTSRPIAQMLAKFNNNRFATTLTVDAEEHALFPKNSVVGRARPTTGIPYGVVGYARARRSTTASTRFRCVGSNTNYQYWRSPTRSTGGGSINAVIGVQHSLMRTNMLRAVFETHGGTARPTSVTVSYREGGAWVTAQSNVTPDGNGVIELYLQDNGTWSSTYNNKNVLTNCAGIQIQVNSMSAGDRYCDVIELSTNYVVDLSDDMETFNLDMSMEDVSPMNPSGVFSSNALSVTFDNTTRRFSDTWTQAELYRHINAEAELTLSTGYNVNNIDRLVPQGTYWVDSWNPSESDVSISAEATDFTRFLQQMDMRDTVFVNKTVSYIVREILEMNGFNNVDVDFADIDEDFVIPFVWFESGTSVWDAVTSVAGSDHGLFYSDKSNVVQYKSKNKLFEQQSPVATFASHTESGNRPNLFSIERDWEQVFNRVNVRYEIFKENLAWDGQTIVNSELWTPSDDVVLRSSPLMFTVPASDLFNVNIGADEIEVWPYEGQFNIEGEIFSYKGKWVYPPNETPSPAVNQIKYNEDQLKDWKYTGDFANMQRALEGSEQVEHDVSVPQNGMRANDLHAPLPWRGAAATENGRFVIATRPGLSYNTWSTYVRGIETDSYQVYGTRLRFPSSESSRKENIGGLLIHKQISDRPHSYYIELSTTDYATKRNIGNLRCYRGGAHPDEGGLVPYQRPDEPAGAPQPAQPLGLFGLPHTEQGIRGYDIAVTYDQDYDLDVVVHIDNNGDQRFSVFVNGVFVTTFIDNKYTEGLFGVFARGSTRVEYEYLYAWSGPESVFTRPGDEQMPSTVVESARFQNRINGDYASGYSAQLRSHSRAYVKWFFDEFAPEVHERREFDIRHNISPAFSNYVISTNPLIAIVKSISTPFKTKFTLDNASRGLEVAHGTDDFSVPGESLNSVLTVYGQALVREEEAIETKSNDDSIRRHGLNEIEITSPWIQSKDHAADIATFIVDQWGKPLDFASAEVVYDPRIEVGDYVVIDDPEGNFHNKRYFVVQKSVSWNDGFECSLTLRRRH